MFSSVITNYSDLNRVISDCSKKHTITKAEQDRIEAIARKLFLKPSEISAETPAELYQLLSIIESTEENLAQFFGEVELAPMGESLFTIKNQIAYQREGILKAIQKVDSDALEEEDAVLLLVELQVEASSERGEVPGNDSEIAAKIVRKFEEDPQCLREANLAQWCIFLKILDRMGKSHLLPAVSMRFFDSVESRQRTVSLDELIDQLGTGPFVCRLIANLIVLNVNKNVIDYKNIANPTRILGHLRDNTIIALYVKSLLPQIRVRPFHCFNLMVHLYTQKPEVREKLRRLFGIDISLFSLIDADMINEMVRRQSTEAVDSLLMLLKKQKKKLLALAQKLVNAPPDKQEHFRKKAEKIQNCIQETQALIGSVREELTAHWHDPSVDWQKDSKGMLKPVPRTWVGKDLNRAYAILKRIDQDRLDGIQKITKLTPQNRSVITTELNQIKNKQESQLSNIEHMLHKEIVEIIKKLTNR